MIYTVRNIARAGIPIFGYNWMPSHVWRTPPKRIRGGAFATAFDDAPGPDALPLTHDRVYSEDEMWANLEYWIKIITPIAEEEGIRLGIHPCDPPVESWAASPSCCADFDVLQAADRDLPERLQRHRVLPGHDVRDGTDGRRHLRQDPLLRLAQQDPVRPLPQRVGHGARRSTRSSSTPATSTCSRRWRSTTTSASTASSSTTTCRRRTRTPPWGHRGRAFANGYIQALIEAVTKQASP